MKVIMLMARDTAKEYIPTITVMCIQESGFRMLRKAMDNYSTRKKTHMKASS